MKKTAFKTEVFLTVPLTFLAFALVCVSLVTQQWVYGKGVYKSNSTIEESDGDIIYNFGLFNGEKTRTRSGTKSYPLKTVCKGGFCMLSCGTSNQDRKDDISNILSDKPCDNSRPSDIFFCDNKEAGNCSEVIINNGMDYNARIRLMKYGTYVSTIFFLSLGLLFTIVSQISSVFNTCHTPIDLIYGTHGLVAWNAIASLSYFLVLCIWGAEIDQRISSSAPISDMARPPPKLDASLGLWTNESQAPGYSYWLIFANFLVHALNCGMVSFYIYKKYKPRQTNKEVGIDVNGKAKDTAMIF